MRLLPYLLCLLIIGCGQPVENKDVNAKEASLKPAASPLEQRLETIKLPDGFKIELYASNVVNARSMCLSPNGVLYVSTRNEGNVYAIQDKDGDNRSDQTIIIDRKLFMPNGVAWKDGDLYVAEVNRILRYRNIDNRLSNLPEPEVVFNEYPDKTHHGWKYIAFGPDGWLYVPVGAPCNICKSPEDIFASITRLNVETGEMEIVQHGVRNTVGFDWHPESYDLWFTDNGGDWLGDDMPACELNFAPNFNMHFGYPFCHQGDYPDPKLGSADDCEKYDEPAQKLGPHVAPLGMEFIEGDHFPAAWKHDVLIAEHGSWNRSKPIGYRLTRVPLDGNEAKGYEVFAEGWLDEEAEEAWGRPVDLEYLPDGSILVSDDKANAIYRISKK